MEEKNKRTNTSAIRGKAMWHFCAALREFAGYLQACNLREISTKPLGMLTHLLTVQLPSSPCLLLLTVSFFGQLSQADCPLLSSFVNSLSLSSLRPSFPRPLPVSWEILYSGSLCGFNAKADKVIPWPAHTHKRKRNATHRVTLRRIIIFTINYLFAHR